MIAEDCSVMLLVMIDRASREVRFWEMSLVIWLTAVVADAVLCVWA